MELVCARSERHELRLRRVLLRLQGGDAREVAGVLEPRQDRLLGRVRRAPRHRPARGVLHPRHVGQATARRPPQRGHLQPRAPQPGGRRRRRLGDVALRHRQPPLPRAHPDCAGGGSRVDRTRRPHQGGLRQRWWRGDRHRPEDGPPRDPAAHDRLGRQGLPRSHRTRGRHRRRAVQQALPVGPAGRVRARPVQRPRSHGGGAPRPGRRRGDHGDHPGDVRLPAPGTRLPRDRQAALRAARHASTSPTRCRPG